MTMTTIMNQLHLPESGSNAQRTNGSPADRPQRVRTRTILVILFVVLAVFATFLVLGIVYRFERNRALASYTSTTLSTAPQVYVVHPVASAAAVYSLPGTTQAIEDSIIYARVSGYLSKRYVDIGDPVKAGQLLAEIQSPELDQQLNQAQANLQQAYKQLDLQKANLELARTTMDRYKGADQEGAVAKQA